MRMLMLYSADARTAHDKRDGGLRSNTNVFQTFYGI